MCIGSHMDNTILSRHMEIIGRYYPNMSITQLGLVVLLLGSLRAVMGHEYAKGTVDNYIHAKHLNPKIRQCLDYIEREVMGLKSSRIDIDVWKHGNVSAKKRKYNKQERCYR